MRVMGFCGWGHSSHGFEAVSRIFAGSCTGPTVLICMVFVLFFR